MKLINYLRARFRKWLNEEIWLEDYIKAGLKIGKNVSIQPGVIFDISHAWLIEIDDNVIIAPQTYILAHDTSTKRCCGMTRLAKVYIGQNVFIGAGSFIMPGVTIAENSIIGANSVVTKNIPPNVVAVGNPAKIICSVEEYKNKVLEDFNKSPQYDYTYTLNGGITEEKKKEMINAISKNGYVK